MGPRDWQTRTAELSRALALASLPLLLLSGCGGETSTPMDRPPNIVLILSDDQGWSDFGFMGSTVVQTPKIDELAAHGVRFSLAFNTASVCRASLRSILTGYYPAQYKARAAADGRAGKVIAGSTDILQIETLPRLLAERGYVSFQGGKYWEGGYRDGGFTKGMAVAPANRRSTGAPLTRLAGGKSLELGRSTMAPLFEFIDENRERPFFVWFAPLLPHRPFDATQLDRAAYENRGLSEPAIGYYANITRLDRRVGELVEYLESRGLREQTLIVFLTDNGWTVGESGDLQQEVWGGPEGKLSMHEAGFRTPLIFSWPSVLIPRVEDEELVSTVDLFATLLDIAGIDRPRDRDGESLWPFLRGRGPFTRDRIMVEMASLRSEPGGRYPFEDVINGAFLRTRDWRYLRVPARGTEALYSMASGADETENVCASHPQLCAEMRSELIAWQERMMTSPPLDRERH